MCFCNTLKCGTVFFQLICHLRCCLLDLSDFIIGIINKLIVFIGMSVGCNLDHCIGTHIGLIIGNLGIYICFDCIFHLVPYCVKCKNLFYDIFRCSHLLDCFFGVGIHKLLCCFFDSLLVCIGKLHIVIFHVCLQCVHLMQCLHCLILDGFL